MQLITPGMYAAALLVLPLACAAAPQEAPLPSGLKGRLHLTVEVAQGKKIERSMTMELNMVSEPTSPVHLLIDPLDEDAKRQQAYLDKAGGILADELANRKPDPNMEADLDSCQKNPDGARCQRALRALQEQDARMQAQAAQAAPPPEWTSQNRYQGWGSDFAKGCGTVLAQVHGGGKEALQLRLPQDDSMEARIFTCGTTMAIDRRARKAVLSIKPGSVAFPGRKGADFLDLASLGKNAGAEGNRMANTLVLRGLVAGADGTAIEGSRTIRASGGTVTTVRWRFVPQS